QLQDHRPNVTFPRPIFDIHHYYAHFMKNGRAKSPLVRVGLGVTHLALPT
ncbi:unnamed protein product, partial [Arabidopsis halleri]